MITTKRTECMAWGTANELAFIEHLGHYSEAGNAMGRAELLLQYEMSMRKRVYWESVDKEAIILALVRLQG